MRCAICFDDFTAPELFTLQPCGHMLDVACAVGAIRRAVDDRSQLPLRCQECRAALAAGAPPPPVVPVETLRSLVRRSRALVYDPSCPPLRRDELERFEMLQAIAQGLLARCPRDGCGERIALEPGGAAPLRVVCSACEEPFCRACEVGWHDGLTCDAFRQRQQEADGASAAFLRAHAARCPTDGCGALFGIHERGHACHHVTCGTCAQNYCYVCRSPWRGGCTGDPRCSTYCDDRCHCPDCVSCRPNQPCYLCSNDGICRVCRPPPRRRR